MKFLMSLIMFVSINSIAQIVQTFVNGDYSVRTEFFYDVNGDRMDNSAKYSLFKNDKELYSIEKLLDRNEPLPTAAVFEDGVLILVYSLSGRIVYYDSTGAIFASSDLNVEYSIEYESTVLIDVEGNSAAVLVSSPVEPNSRLFLHKSNAERINVIEVKGFQGSGLKFIDEKKIVASTYYWLDSLVENTFFYTIDGDLLGKIPIRFDQCDFDKDYFIGYYNKKAFLIDLHNYEMIFEFEPIEGEMIVSAKILEDKIIITSSKFPELKEGKWYYKNIRIEEFNKIGKKLNKKEIETSEYLEMEIIPDNGNIIILIVGKE
ncbi:MAG: hypothetical protein JXA68_09050 [Ignavibacteriales bacterium]|nr:hypothetical protein [Ignavibacteriales bacterium]